jgi:uridine kinase
MSHETRLIIGVAGGTGSGKTTVARAITGSFAEKQCIYIDFDAYYRDLSHLPFKERTLVNFDAPSALEAPLLCTHLDRLREGETIEKPKYNFAKHVRREETETIEAAPVVVLEGIHVLSVKEVREKLDIRLFVDTDADLRVLRRIRRDIEERGRTFDDVEAQYLSSVRPMHQKFVEPSRRFADLVIPEGGENRVAIGMFIEALKRFLGEASEVFDYSRD